MLGAILLGLVGGLTYTLIILNPGFRFSKLGISGKDLFIAVGVNGLLGGIAGFLGWSLSAGEVPPPRSYAVYLLFGVGGGSLIQSLALAVANKDSRATLDRTLQAVEALSAGQAEPAAGELRSLSGSLRDVTDPRERDRLATRLLQAANDVKARLRE
jgi:hypothetical protein